jgi:putative Mg2+ transporter-C (MgtC) family protein
MTSYLDLEQLRLVGEVALAMVLGGAVGYERERAQKPAGLRTHMMIAGAAALFVALGNALVVEYASEPFGELIRADPTRIVVAVVTGIGILGAGTIFRRSDDHVEGLTTAASLLFVGALGAASAVGQYTLAVAGTALALLSLRGVGLLERRRGRGR